MDKDNKDVNIEPEIVDLEQRAHKAGRPATSWADLEGMATPKIASRIQSKTAKALGGRVPPGSLASRIQSAAYRNVTGTEPKGVEPIRPHEHPVARSAVPELVHVSAPRHTVRRLTAGPRIRKIGIPQPGHRRLHYAAYHHTPGLRQRVGTRE